MAARSVELVAGACMACHQVSTGSIINQQTTVDATRSITDTTVGRVFQTPLSRIVTLISNSSSSRLQLMPSHKSWYRTLLLYKDHEYIKIIVIVYWNNCRQGD